MWNTIITFQAVHCALWSIVACIILQLVASNFTVTYSQVFICMQIARNITTNELANASRYWYLRGPDGRFRNPYNHGCRKNCTGFLIQGYSDDDKIVWPSIEQAAR